MSISKRSVTIGVVVLIAFAAIGFVLLSRKASSQFATEFTAYEKLAAVQETAAYTPAAEDNPVRQQLNVSLSETLQPSISATDRLKDARQGLSLLSQLEKQVDAIGDSSDPANAALAKMQVEMLNDLSVSDSAKSLLSLAKQRSDIIEDIRGLSYRSDFETQKIFDRIVDDKGVLTPAYIAELNNDIPSVEADFDHRSQLYTQLTQLSTQVDQGAEQLGIQLPVSTSSVPQ